MKKKGPLIKQKKNPNPYTVLQTPQPHYNPHLPYPKITNSLHVKYNEKLKWEKGIIDPYLIIHAESLVVEKSRFALKLKVKVKMKQLCPYTTYPLREGEEDDEAEYGVEGDETFQRSNEWVSK